MPNNATLIVALDFPNGKQAIACVESLPETVTHYKIGLELFIAEGPAIIKAVTDLGRSVFLDLKLHDIPNTVAKSVTTACEHGVSLLTLHASGGRAMMEAAAAAAAEYGESAPQLLAVTALTSLSQEDFADLGIKREMTDHVLALGRLAVSSGIDGMVCSPLEAGTLRGTLGPEPLLVTPGIRPADASLGDQKRAATPASAVEAGANYLVVGRPITQAGNPAESALSILREMSIA